MTSAQKIAVSVSGSVCGSVSRAVARVQRWLASTDLSRAEIAARASVDEKTLRLAARATWNPTANTLARLEALIPPDWSPTPEGETRCG